MEENNLKDEYISKLKQVALAEAGVRLDDLSRYERYLENTANVEELEEQSRQLVEDIGGNKDGKSGNNGKVWRL